MALTRNQILFTLALINFTHIVDSMLIMPLGDIFIEQFKINATQYSLLVSGYAFGAVVSGLIAIFYLDIVDRKNALQVAYLGFGVGTFLCAFAESYAVLLSLRFLTGLFGGILGSIVLSIVSDIYKFEERGTAMGILTSAFAAASALGIPFGLYLAAVGTWHIPFLVIGTLATMVSILLFFKFPSMTAHLAVVSKDRNAFKVLNDIISDRNQVAALLAGFILVLGHFLIIPFISPYLIKNVGFTQMEISYQFFFGGVVSVFTSPFIGRMVDKYGFFRVFVIMLFFSFIPTYLITNMPAAPISYVLIITTLFFIGGVGRMVPANTIITASAPTSNRASFMSSKSMLQQLAIALAAFISGRIVFIGDDGLFQNYEYVGYLSIAVCLICILFIRRIGVASGN